MRKTNQLLSVALLISLGACSGDTEQSTVDDEYDLSLYQFHTNVLTNGGEITITENYYSQSTGEGPVYAPTLRYLNVDGAIQRISVSGTVFEQSTITDTHIDKEGVSYTGFRRGDRFASIGDTYLDAEVENLTLKQNCTLQNHLESFDLGTATGDHALASGVYEDVIQVYCVSVFTNADGSTRPNYDWNRYYAKGLGLISIDGRWPNFLTGDIYAIPQF
ncbi:MAG: hypothetical protein AAF404_13285 [Pseudomonadota bacterium]